ncbi:uncharacterized protein N7483_004482 [Penicillium malachiteum]|uniref:uncharacterized protein n=1 Tax=Penicillium malachiteum TaxID=1324776 RepID=UPI002546965B|nr:uncharacterized protein N7483_004482 [Penicillium malachiteum]KAJ5729974.1 hypothetical protein N7483_004482 [Penicillium malachiteum]
MEATRSWFSQGPFKGKYVRDTIISIQDPVPCQWKIIRVRNERGKQITKGYGQQGLVSLAAIRLECRRQNIRGSRLRLPKIEIRVYVQVPYTNTELEAPDIRAEQAADFQPDELKAYKMMTADEFVSKFTPKLLGYEEGKQGNLDLVPGGFHITVAWGHLPGIRLGGPCRTPNDPFWKFKRFQRDGIREQFKDRFMEMIRLRVFPWATNSTNLLFDKQSGRLYWIDFNDAVSGENVTWDDGWFICFDLANPPEGDTS